MEFGELQKEIKRVSLRHWQRKWREARQGRYRYEVDPELRPGRVQWKRRDNEVFFIRMRLGVVKTGDWRNLILKQGTGLCPRGCNEPETDEFDEEEIDQRDVRDTLRHILFECPKLNRAREYWTNILNRKGGQWTLNQMFTGRESFKAVVGFLQETNLFRSLCN